MGCGRAGETAAAGTVCSHSAPFRAAVTPVTAAPRLAPAEVTALRKEQGKDGLLFSALQEAGDGV